MKTLAAIDRGIPRKEVQDLFGVSRSTIKRWLKRRRQTGGDESGTRVGQYADGALFFRCEHAHCREIREWRQFRAECDPIVHLGRARRARGRLR